MLDGTSKVGLLLDKISCRSKATGALTTQTQQEMGGKYVTGMRNGGKVRECPEVTIRRKHKNEQSLSSFCASEEVNRLSHPGGTQRPFLTDSADTTMTLAPSRHLPSTLIILAIAAKRTRQPCPPRGERRGGGAGLGRRRVPGDRARCAGQVCQGPPPPPAQQCCHFALSPPAFSQGPGQLS